LPVAEDLEAKKPPLLEVRESSVFLAQMRQAHKASVTGDYAKALVAYDKILAERPESTDAMTGKAYALQQTGRFGEAATLDRRLMQLQLDNDAAKSNLAAALTGLATPEAEAELAQMTSADPQFAPAQAGLAKRLEERGETADALLHMQKALELAPQNNAYRLGLATFYDRADRTEEALALYRQVLQAKATAIETMPLTRDAIEQRIQYLAAR
jgi:Flp pilus assembly protein TadD